MSSRRRHCYHGRATAWARWNAQGRIEVQVSERLIVQGMPNNRPAPAHETGSGHACR